MKWLVESAAVGAAGCAGALARLAVGRLCGRMFATDFPVGTLVINLSGCFLVGWFYAFASRRDVSEVLRTGVAVGFVGAYTTFSTFAYESNDLLGKGETLKAMANLVGSVVVGLLAARAGMWVAGK